MYKESLILNGQTLDRKFMCAMCCNMYGLDVNIDRSCWNVDGTCWIGIFLGLHGYAWNSHTTYPFPPSGGEFTDCLSVFTATGLPIRIHCLVLEGTSKSQLTSGSLALQFCFILFDFPCALYFTFPPSVLYSFGVCCLPAVFLSGPDLFLFGSYGSALNFVPSTVGNWRSQDKHRKSSFPILLVFFFQTISPRQSV